VVLADTTGNGLATFQVANNGRLMEQNQLADQQAAFTDQISALSVATVGRDSFVLAASARNHSITAYAVSSNGTLSPASTLGAQQFLPIATPQDMATVSLQGQSFVVLASAGIGSLTVLSLDSAGVLSPVDQVTDSLNTRFQGAQILETHPSRKCLCHRCRAR
jgi:6-phosphogluconolactonase (cycloisomerase 2 family)